jgi:neurofibromin 1
MALEASIQISKEYGLGSPQAEAMVNTCVTLSNILVRSKLVANTLRLLQQTTSNPTQILSDHPLWPDIAIMTRFNLMLSFDNRGPTKNYVPDILHIVTMLVGVGPTLIRTTMLGIVVNLIQSLSIAPKLPDDNRRELQQLMGETGDKRTQLMFGLVKPYANAFTITPDTLTDPLTEPFDLPILHTIITRLLKILDIGALTTDIANAWRSRWMGHVCSIVFQPNPAIQPRAFVALGCLGRQQVSDDILHHILSALHGTLLDFDPDNPILLLSITMCLRNVVENVDSDSRYLVPLFWVALAILSIGHPSLVCQATELLQGVLQCMNSHHLCDKGEAAMKKIIFDTRKSYGDIAYELDKLNGVNFQSHFSFAVAGILMKGWGTSQGKEAAYQCLLTFLNCATRHAKDAVEETVLGYVACLISVAWQAQLGQDVLRFAGVHWEPRGCTAQTDNHDRPCRFGVNGNDGGNKGETTTTTADPSQSSETASLFNKLGVSDNDTALLFLSCLIAQLKNVRNEAEEIFLYELLSDAAAIIPDVFCIVYPTMLPQLDQLIISSNSEALLNAIQPILTAAYSDSRFQYPKTTLQHKLASLGFSLLEDPSAPVSPSHMVKISSLTAMIVKTILQ